MPEPVTAPETPAVLAPAPETVVFARGDVRVTSERVVAGDESYDLDGVISARRGVLSPSRLGPLLAGFFGVAALFNGPAYVVPGVAVLVVAAVWWGRQASSSVVVLKTRAGEIQALKSPDHALVEAVVAALDRALAARG